VRRSRVPQTSLVLQAEFQRFAKKTRREQFLDEMERVMPWAELLALIELTTPRARGAQAGGTLDHAAGQLFIAVVCAVAPGG